MAKFYKDPDGKLIAALGNDVATPAGCTELTANTEDAAHEKHVPVVESERDGHVIRARVGSVEHPMVPPQPTSSRSSCLLPVLPRSTACPVL